MQRNPITAADFREWVKSADDESLEKFIDLNLDFILELESDDVKRYRDENSCSIFTAKAHFERQQILELVNIAHLNSDFDLLCDIVRQLVMKANFHEA